MTYERDKLQVPGVRIIRKLGHGAFGKVFRGHDIELDIPVAVKVFDVGSTRTNRLAAYREARQMARLSHPNLVRVYKAGVADGRVFVVMDYVGGENLYKLVNANGPFPQSAAAFTMAKILDVLDFLHGQIPPVVHMDVSPVNIMIDRVNNEPWLMDLGSAVSQNARKPFCEGFAAPERQIDGHPDPKMDIYAAGACLFFLLTGQPPGFVRSRKEMAGLPYAGLLSRMLDPTPEKRPTASECSAMLKGAESYGGSSQRFWWVIAAAAGAFFVLLAFFALIVTALVLI